MNRNCFTNHIRAVLIVSIFLLVGVGSTKAQMNEIQREYFNLNESYSVSMAAVQINAPIEFKTIDFRVPASGESYDIRWVLKNKTDKTVTRFVVEIEVRHSVLKWKKFGHSAEYDVNPLNDLSIELMAPNAEYESDTEVKVSTVPETIRQIFESNSSYKGFRGVICIGKIKLVEFRDGTRFEDNSPAFTSFRDR